MQYAQETLVAFHLSRGTFPQEKKARIKNEHGRWNYTR